MFGYYVYDFECYGVVDFDDDWNVFLIEEKFEVVKFNYVVIGLYYYDNWVVDFVKEVKLFLCGELEIIDFNNMYL